MTRGRRSVVKPLCTNVCSVTTVVVGRAGGKQAEVMIVPMKPALLIMMFLAVPKNHRSRRREASQRRSSFRQVRLHPTVSLLWVSNYVLLSHIQSDQGMTTSIAFLSCRWTQTASV